MLNSVLASYYERDIRRLIEEVNLSEWSDKLSSSRFGINSKKLPLQGVFCYADFGMYPNDISLSAVVPAART